MFWMSLLTYLKPVFHFYTPWKRIKMEHWVKIGQYVKNILQARMRMDRISV